MIIYKYNKVIIILKKSVFFPIKKMKKRLYGKLQSFLFLQIKYFQFILFQLRLNARCISCFMFLTAILLNYYR